MKFTRDELKKAMLLYAVTDRAWLKEGESLAEVCKEVLEGGATFLQIREKELDAASFLEEAKELCHLCREYGIPYVVNDNVEIALECDADGVHVGQTDIRGRDIRALIGEDKILGISAGTVEEAIAAEQAGADYIGVGAIFSTSTKKNARNMTMETLREICRAVSIPAVAIGGINGENIAQLQHSGVDGVAVVSAIFAAEDKQAATAALLQKAKEMLVVEE